MSNELLCSKFGVCGGCGWGGRPLIDQQAEKLAMVKEIAPDALIVFAPLKGIRDKVDMVWAEVDGEMRLGFYGLKQRDPVDVDSCPMMTDALSDFYRQFRKMAPPIKKGSVRLRVSPDGDWGVWLDFANEDVKHLFEEKTYLRSLSEIAFIEIGQRRKALEWRDGQPKLGEPILKPWFQTYDANFKPITLYSTVGGFSQVGFNANQALVRAVVHSVESTKLRFWTDLFCGNGNFTLAMAARGYEVDAIEIDELALEGLRMSANSHAEWTERIHIRQADIYLKPQLLPSFKDRGLIVDPPRSGLRELLDLNLKASPPQAIVYISCNTETFLRDTHRLIAMNYKLVSLYAVDQFPHSPHCEWIGTFVR